MTGRFGGTVVAEYDMTRSTVGTEPIDLAAPEATRAPAPTPQINVTSEELAPGVWYLAGGSHHSVLVEFNEYLMLIETPQNDARTLAVIAKARELRPNKPLRYAVNTHHHHDHSGGVRAAMAEGLTIVTHSGNAAFYRDVAKRSHTLQPDALARAAKTPTIVTVERQAGVPGSGAHGRAPSRAREPAQLDDDRRVSADGANARAGGRVQPAGA